MAEPIVIDGITLPPLKQLQITREKVWSSNTGRAANGEMIGDIVGYKYTLKCTWPILSDEQAKVIDNAVETAFFNATFHEPKTNTWITRTFYAGTPTYDVYSYAQGIKTYSGISVDLIEK